MSLRQGQKAKALFDYEARAPDELSFKRRDIITVLDKDEEDEGWYTGELNGARGLFPHNYVQLLEETPAAPPSSGNLGTKVKMTLTTTTDKAPVYSVGSPDPDQTGAAGTWHANASFQGNGVWEVRVKPEVGWNGNPNVTIKATTNTEPEMGEEAEYTFHPSTYFRRLDSCHDMPSRPMAEPASSSRASSWSVSALHRRT